MYKFNIYITNVIEHPRKVTLTISKKPGRVVKKTIEPVRTRNTFFFIPTYIVTTAETIFKESKKFLKSEGIQLSSNDKQQLWDDIFNTNVPFPGVNLVFEFDGETDASN